MRSTPFIILIQALCLLTMSCSFSSRNHRWLSASPESLPRWRGFNLLGMFSKDWASRGFIEEDFRLISELGFNFARLPLDYRLLIKDGDWTKFDETALQDIDQAIEWGEKYGIHVCINLHRAPGYTVAEPKEKTDLWTDEETQRVCALQWAFFARRYAGIPNERLSFNLINEPGKIDGETYARVAERLVDAIRQEDPDRLIIADGDLPLQSFLDQWRRRNAVAGMAASDNVRLFIRPVQAGVPVGYEAGRPFRPIHKTSAARRHGHQSRAADGES